jgi:N-acetylmuramoyl-L-alanine amidase
MTIHKLAANSNNYTKGRSSAISYLVVHYTANDGDSAKGNCNYFAQAGRNASAHYFVDKSEVWQSVEGSDTAWHCGTNGKYYCNARNANSIGVELCSHKDSSGNYYFDNETVANAAELIKELMKKYNIPLDRVVRHYDVTHKLCPAPFVNNSSLWESFKKKLEVSNVISSYDEAMKVLISKGVISSREYWDNAVKCVKYLDQLIINTANKLNN